jgi:hypothetical protein
MLLLFRPFHIGNDVEVTGMAGRSSLYGLVWGAAIVNHSAIKQCVLDHVSA